MLRFDRLDILSSHIHYLQDKFHRDNIFLVGGCIRDLLLGLVDNPTDIDLTTTGNPTDIYEQLDKNDISHFITEKFGTMTVIPKDNKETQYELTPLRTETKYDDHRHPEEITRSDSVLDDAARRDFTINCMYYFTTNIDTPTQNALATKESHTRDEKIIKKDLKKNGLLYIKNLNLIIVQKPEAIQQWFVNGQFDTHAFLAYTDFINHGRTYTSSGKDIANNCHPEFSSESGDTETSSAGQSNTLKANKKLSFIIDPYGGITDLFNGKLKAVGDPDKRFYEDGLRVLRALRFVNVINGQLNAQGDNNIPRLDYDRETRQSIKKNYYLVQFIAKERIKDELMKAFAGHNPFGFIALLDEANLLKHIFPALHANKHDDQPVRYHPFDTYTHILLTLYELQQINDNPLVRLGMLYHDVGKKDQYHMYKIGIEYTEARKTLGGRINHTVSGVDHVKKDFGALGFSKKEIEEIAWYVNKHMRPGEILQAKEENREKKLRELLSEAGYERVCNLLDITIGDRRGHYNPLQNSSIDEVFTLKTLLDDIYEKEGQFTKKKLAISGNDIMQCFAIAPGKKVGELLDTAFNRVLDDIETRNNKKIILEHLEEIMK